MSLYNVLQAIPMSFYSRSLYRDVAQSWGGKTFLYTLLLVLIVSFGYAYKFQTLVNFLYQNEGEQIVDQIPVLTIKNGEVSTPEKKPYFIKELTTDTTIGIVDTTGKYTQPTSEIPFLLTKTNFMSYEESQNKYTTYPIAKTSDGVYNPEELYHSFKPYLSNIGITFYIVMVIFMFLWRVLQSLFYGALGLFFKGITGASLGFGQLINIALIALTPATIIGLIGTLLLAPPFLMYNYFWLIYFIITLGYVYFGVVSNKEPEAVK